MALYEIRLLPSVRKDFRGIEKSEVRRLLRAIEKLTENPRPPDCRKLTGSNLYRIRVGNYRIVYEIYDEESVLVIVKLGHRRDVYG